MKNYFHVQRGISDAITLLTTDMYLQYMNIKQSQK